MNVDTAFTTGKSHATCQDFAISEKSNNIDEYRNTIVIADGCSGSPFTDFGARILAKTAINQIRDLGYPNLHEFDEEQCILSARPLIKMLNLPTQCLDTTLLFASACDSQAQIITYGDGVIAIKIKTGDIIIINAAYTDSYPFYINYLYDKKRRHENWLDDHDKKEVSHFILRNNGKVEIIDEKCDFHPRLEIDGNEIGTMSIQLQRTIIDIVSFDTIEFIAIMSDGVHSFYESITTETSKYNQHISYFDILRELLSFKSFNSKFVQRRLNKFTKDCEKKNWLYMDDVSLGVIYLGE